MQILSTFFTSNICLLLLLLAACTTKAQSTMPNILFLMCDSMDGRNMDPTTSQYPLISMPTLRSIASQGVNFIRTYTNSPQCVPGRAAMMTGRHTHKQGGYSNNLGFALSSNGTMDKSCKSDYGEETCNYFGTKMQNNNYTLLDAMQDVGYAVYLYGKIDIGGNMIHLPSQANSTADGWHGAPTLVVFTRSANIDKATKPSPTSSSMLNDSDKKVHSEDHTMAAKCVERLNWLGSQKRDSNGSDSGGVKPWFLQCSFNIPHPAFDTNATWLQGVNISGIEIPPTTNETMMHPYDQYMSISKNVWTYFNDSQIRTVRETYYGMNVETDYLFKGVWNAALANGFNLSNTIVVFVSDHGEMNMEHRQVWKNSFYEASSRIPLVIAGPGIKQNVVVKNLTQIIDILPTLIELSTQDSNQIPSWLDGQSLVRFLDDSNTSEHSNKEKQKEKEKENKNKHQKKEKQQDFKDYVMSQYHSNMGNTGAYMIRQNEYKYIQFGHYLKAFANYSAQLFDVDNDIWEMNDLSKQRSTNATIDEIMTSMEDLLKSEIDYEYVDCKAKQNDFYVFEKFFWQKYNSSKLYSLFQSSYDNFDDSDMETIENWRTEVISLGNGSIEVCDSLLH